MTNIKIYSKNKKSGTLSQNEMDAALVGNARFKLTLSMLLKQCYKSTDYDFYKL